MHPPDYISQLFNLLHLTVSARSSWQGWKKLVFLNKK